MGTHRLPVGRTRPEPVREPARVRLSSVPHARSTEDVAGLAPDIVFRPVHDLSRLWRTFPWLLALLGVAAAALATAAPNVLTIGFAVACGIGVLATWAAALLQPTPKVSITDGVLEITEAEGHHVFDLACPDTEVRIIGKPTSWRWQARFERRHIRPYVVDRHMVKPREFTDAVLSYRPS